MTLRRKIIFLVLLNIALVLAFTLATTFIIFMEQTFKKTGSYALSIARIVANLPDVIDAFQKEDPSSIIQPIAENIRKQTNAEFVVVGNMNLIRYSHPKPDRIGQRMVGDDNEQVLKGKESVTQAVGTLGLSVRGKVPIFDDHGKQIGVVSVGFLVRDIWSELYKIIGEFALFGVAAMLIGTIGAYVLSGHIKKQLLNLEPSEIAFLKQQQDAILSSIREGVIAVNTDGRVVTLNREMSHILGQPVDALIGQTLSGDCGRHHFLDVLRTGQPLFHVPMIVSNMITVSNIVPVLLDGQIIGAVGTFQAKTELDQIDQMISDINHYTEMLRSQKHEFMNKLHLISGLIHIAEYDRAKEVIRDVQGSLQHQMQTLLDRIHDHTIAGILIGKMHRANELGIQFEMGKDVYSEKDCQQRNITITILGNLIDNAFDALMTTDRHPKHVFVSLRCTSELLDIEVMDNGYGIPNEIRSSIFEDGVTTKGRGRGFGLSLVKRLVNQNGGTISFESSENGTTFKVYIAFKKK